MQAILSPSSARSTATPAAAAPAGKKVWTGRVLGTLLVLFLAVDAAGKLLRLAPYVEGTARVGYPAGVLVPLGLVLLACTALYAIPRTAVLGAVLLTGYLGGATATHVHMGEPFVFPVVFGVLLWVSLLLRDAHLRGFLRALAAPRR
jgi:hypothetical protein